MILYTNLEIFDDYTQIFENDRASSVFNLIAIL